MLNFYKQEWFLPLLLETKCPELFDCFTVLLLLLLSHFSRVWRCATPYTAAHQAPPSLGFSRQEHWSGLPFPSPMHESEKWKWGRSVVPDPQRPHGLQPTRLLHPWDFPGKSTIIAWNKISGTLWLLSYSLSTILNLCHNFRMQLPWQFSSKLFTVINYSEGESFA